jgi:hypothetical protein
MGTHQVRPWRMASSVSGSCGGGWSALIANHGSPPRRSIVTMPRQRVTSSSQRRSAPCTRTSGRRRISSSTRWATAPLAGTSQPSPSGRAPGSALTTSRTSASSEPRTTSARPSWAGSMTIGTVAPG